MESNGYAALTQGRQFEPAREDVRAAMIEEIIADVFGGRRSAFCKFYKNLQKRLGIPAGTPVSVGALLQALELSRPIH